MRWSFYAGGGAVVFAVVCAFSLDVSVKTSEEASSIRRAVKADVWWKLAQCSQYLAGAEREHAERVTQLLVEMKPERKAELERALELDVRASRWLDSAVVTFLAALFALVSGVFCFVVEIRAKKRLHDKGIVEGLVATVDELQRDVAGLKREREGSTSTDIQPPPPPG